ncbi:hypothetical protein ABZX85_13710 [Streptomyces sp. NPDC004539]|uniref:hypothetical protein n=1 Tax=Streptomyces sp. NPDC004539 TaxID=3154280 RepID=UPI0033A6E032
MPPPPTLTSLGLARAPRDHPLTYPGPWPAASALLQGDRLLPLDRLTHPGRTPVLAVGSNACPGQLRHKMDEFGIASPIPMTKARVAGLEVGVSAHVSRLGYISASPVDAPGAVRELFVIWLDDEQLRVVDASEGADSPEGNYARVPLPGPEFRVELENGHVLPGTYAYVNRHGVLHDGTGAPRRHLDQRTLITELLKKSAELRRLFGGTPEEFCARARADADLCERGTRLLREEKLVTASGLEHLYAPRRRGRNATPQVRSAGPPS